jgi:hypothetical protein
MKILGTCLLALGLLAGCATTGGGSLDSAASRLDESARDFYRELRDEPGSDHTDADAAAFVEATRDFERAVNSSRSRDELKPAFDRVAERYHHLRAQLDDGDYHDRYERAGFDRVTEDYLDVDRAMNHRDSRYHD